MKYLKTYENNEEIFDKNFEIGEIVYCIDNSMLPPQKSLKLYNKYKVINKPTTALVTIYTYNFHNNRFIHIKDIERWKLYNDVKKFKI